MTFTHYLQEKAELCRSLARNCFDHNVAHKLRELAEDLEKKSAELAAAATLAKKAPHLGTAADDAAAQLTDGADGPRAQMDRD